MKKLYIILGIVIVLGAVIYFTGLYTIFVRTEIHEEVPMILTSTTASAMPSPLVVAQGTFGEVDFIHKGSGTAKLIDVEGKQFLRLENLNVERGPDLYVYLVKNDKPTGDIK